MQFENTETFKNLARSFAGECQAGMRYQMIVKLAMQEGKKTLADAIRTIAKNETLHATQFFNKIIEKTGSRENISFDAGYPFHAGTLVEGLKFALIFKAFAVLEQFFVPRRHPETHGLFFQCTAVV